MLERNLQHTWKSLLYARWHLNMAKVEAIAVSGSELLRVVSAWFSNKVTLEIISAEKHDEQKQRCK